MADDDEQAQAIAALDALGPAHAVGESDKAPVKARRTRSGTSRAQRAAKAATGPAASRAPRAARAPSARRPNIAAGMAQLYTMGGLALSMVPSGLAVAGNGAGRTTITGAAGAALVASSGDLGAVWEAAAKDDPRIREALEKLLSVSTLGQIITAHLPVVLVAMCAAGAVSEDVLVRMGLMVEAAPAAAPAAA